MNAQRVDGRRRIGNAEFTEKYVAHDKADDLAVDLADDRGIDVGILVQDAGNLALVVLASRFFRCESVDRDDGIQIPLPQHAHYSFLIRHFIPPCLIGSATGAPHP